MTNSSNGEVLDFVKEYINKAKWAILATVTPNNQPALRTIATFANDGLDLYFSTAKNTAKVGQIENNPTVTLFFQLEGQEMASFKNVSYTGQAVKLDGEQELMQAIDILNRRIPKYKERMEKGLKHTAIFKVQPGSVKFLDFSNGMGPAAVKEITF